MPDSSPTAMFALFWPILFVVIVIVVALYSYQSRKRRAAEMAALASQLGFQYCATMSEASFMAGMNGAPAHQGVFATLASAFECHDPFLDRFGGMYPFGQGGSRRYSNLIFGDRNGASWYAFDYQYTVSNGKSSTTYHFTVVATRQAMLFPFTTIRPENLGDRMGAIVGIHDIQFESEEFNKRYNVTSESERFAFDLVHPQMIEYLMGMRDRHMQLGGFYVVCAASGFMPAAEILAAMSDMERFVALVPGFVKQDIGFQPKWTSPLG